jgi:hypothetical protein
MGRLVASLRLKAGVASLPPKARLTPPKETVALVRVVVASELAGKETLPAETVRPLETVREPLIVVVARVGVEVQAGTPPEMVRISLVEPIASVEKVPVPEK